MSSSSWNIFVAFFYRKMHTKSAKQVLSPLADAVAALIVIISESEISGAATPDLTQLSKAVDTQIRNLVVVAKKICNQSTATENLKKDMPVACEEGKFNF